VIETPIGPLRVVVDGDVVVEIAFDAKKPSTPGPLAAEAERQLTAYFQKKLAAFDLPVSAPGTAFQKRVWTRLCAIKPGTTTTYGALAKELSSGPRAVGTANGSNPVAIVVPCHRVIGSNGDLTGYGGGLHRKRWLLQHEGAVLL
jgi:methylated-DNA-[protein]-cysteine S-methyltransferase